MTNFAKKKFGRGVKRNKFIVMKITFYDGKLWYMYMYMYC